MKNGTMPNGHKFANMAAEIVGEVDDGIILDVTFRTDGNVINVTP